jgi:hypothetical protein
VVEVYTQAAFGIRHSSNGSYHRISGQEYVQDLHTHIGRHMVLLADQDLAWTFSQMATADVFVHSKSTLSIAAGILNTQVSLGCQHRVQGVLWDPAAGRCRQTGVRQAQTTGCLTPARHHPACTLWWDNLHCAAACVVLLLAGDQHSTASRQPALALAASPTLAASSQRQRHV